MRCRLEQTTLALACGAAPTLHPPTLWPVSGTANSGGPSHRRVTEGLQNHTRWRRRLGETFGRASRRGQETLADREGDAPAEPPVWIQNPKNRCVGKRLVNVGPLPIGAFLSGVCALAARPEPRPPEYRPQPKQKEPRIEHRRNTDLSRRVFTEGNKGNEGERANLRFLCFLLLIR